MSDVFERRQSRQKERGEPSISDVEDKNKPTILHRIFDINQVKKGIL